MPQDKQINLFQTIGAKQVEIELLREEVAERDAVIQNQAAQIANLTSELEALKNPGEPTEPTEAPTDG